MKYGWKHIEPDAVPPWLRANYCNTPTGVMTDEGGEGQPLVIYHPGLNLTPDGEWIAAPGLNTVVAGCSDDDESVELSYLRFERDALKQKVEALTIELDEAKDKIDELDNELIKRNDILNRAAGHTEMAADLLSAVDVKLKAIEQWATKPCVDVKLRLAQAHVLKLVRGEA
jgi:hypothetical protein